ncbi:hypothetical protein NGUA15_04295 [Salmonella enterica]|nr:hypothetical protein NGUA15_04295 [Salmonella enterica]
MLVVLAAISVVFWLILSVLAAISVVFCDTFSLVANSWEPLTASVLSAARVPAARLVILLSLPLWLALNALALPSHNRASSVSVVTELLRLLILVVLVAISVVF